MNMSAGPAPIRVGLLIDLVFPPAGRWNVRQDFIDALVLTWGEAVDSGRLDRPVELVLRQVEGLPRGAVKPVIDAWQELADAGCVLVLGPLVAENAIALREHIERNGFVPTLGWCGSEEWLGEWTFALSDGSLAEEPYVLTDLLAAAGLFRIGVSSERSGGGEDYLATFTQACAADGIEILESVSVPPIASDATDLVATLRAAGVEAIVHLGFGPGLVRINTALAAAGWDPPRYTTTAWENCYLSDELFAAFAGWIGLEHYDETNPVGEAWLDRFAARYGRRPAYAYPLLGHDIGRVVVGALRNARPLSPSGVKRGLEQVKMLPAACGSPGVRISFGPQRRNGWHGAGYLTARSVSSDGTGTVFRGRFGVPQFR